MIRRRIVHGDEQDAFTGWRKYYRYLQRPGACKQVKTRANRRERREGKDEIRSQLSD